ncbi:hypothetical protein XENOCAPTIV_003548 [Xenoophorus captivus]|uniref:Uncharacterized protein n=1 Tax=Xenoophorus captivus TaxID=1517983 RepID=A0ABV0RPZ6_9TELE
MATWWRNLLCSLPSGGLTTDKEKDLKLKFFYGLERTFFSLTCSLSPLLHVTPPFPVAEKHPSQTGSSPTSVCSMDLERNQRDITGSEPNIQHHHYESNSSCLKKPDT